MTLSRLVLHQGENGIHITVERLMFDILLSFAKINFTMMSSQKRRSLFQELHGASPSSRRVIISAKQFMGKAMEHPTINPFEEHLAGLLGGRKMVLSEYLRVCEQIRQDFDGPRRLSRSTKREMLEWTEGHWEEIGLAFTFVAASQTRMSTPQLSPFRISDQWHQDQFTIDETP
jgi:hypothetical protein